MSPPAREIPELTERPAGGSRKTTEQRVILVNESAQEASLYTSSLQCVCEVSVSHD